MTITALENELRSAHRIAQRLERSLESTRRLIPLDINTIKKLTDEDQEKLDALLLRFMSLASVIQDRIARSVLLLEEENLTNASRKDMRLMLEKLGALREEREFGIIVELKNMIAHTYPEDLERQAQILNTIHLRGRDLIESLKDMTNHARRKILQMQFPSSNLCDENLDVKPGSGL
jgi:hypothetical protein